MTRMKRVLTLSLAMAVVVAAGVSAQTKVKAAFIVSNMANESQAFSAK